MSNALGIAAATATLRNLLLTRIPELDATLSDLDVTTQPLDLARKGNLKPQLNIFLYHTALNAAWRNMDMPNQSKSGERGTPPLALNLYYIITAFAREDSDNNDPSSHRVFCSAMSVLHDTPILAKADIQSALPGNDLALQLERIRITPQPLSVDEIHKLWTAYQTPYRISAAYELTVALIDSNLAAKSALPVLKRGDGDRGVFAVASAAPQLVSLAAPNKQQAGRLGENLVLAGDNLSAADTVLRFEGLRFDARIELTPTTGANPGELTVRIPDNGPPPNGDPQAYVHWAPGFYGASLITQMPGLPEFSSNQIGFSLAPAIAVSPLTALPGNFTLNVSCTPQLRDGQKVWLLFGDAQVAPHSITAAIDDAHPTELTFNLTGIAAGTYLVRLRVDGVDSIPVTYSGTPAVPSFDVNQQVVVKP